MEFKYSKMIRELLDDGENHHKMEKPPAFDLPGLAVLLCHKEFEGWSEKKCE